jgi:hypothetical protein
VSVAIAAQWKKDEREYNGLDCIANELMEDPHRRRRACITYETVRITEDVADGTRQPTVRILAIEPVDNEDAETVGHIMDRRFTERTGRGMQDSLLDLESVTGSAPEGPFPGDDDELVEQG